MNRIDRVSAILIQLQSKKWVTASEIANRFGISLRTVYRDLKALEEAGIPVGAEAGKGYYLVDGFHLPPVMFTRNEAAALLMAEKIVEKLTDNSISENYQSALFKIKSVLPETEKQFITDLNTNIEVHYSRHSDTSKNYLWVIQQALVSNTILTLEYRSQQNEVVTTRQIEPIGLSFYSLNWHLVAYCRLRNEYRDFRVDRMENLNSTTEKFTPREKIKLSEYFSKYAKSMELTEVSLSMHKKTAYFLQNSKYYYGFVSQELKKDTVEMDFLTNDLDYFGRWLLTFADTIEILKPKELSNILNKLVSALKIRY